MKRIGILGVVAIAVALNAPRAIAGDKPVAVAGAGTALLTDPNLGLEALGINVPPRGGEYPLAFAVAATVKANGTARGTAEFVYGRGFSRVFDADIVVLSCSITGGTVHADGSVTLTGTSYEQDFSFGEGVFFEEISAFEMVIARNGDFTLRWCDFPGPFDMEVTRGRVTVR